jgi:dTDP-4-amino-4,6-dideoxygalactose transaminase
LAAYSFHETKNYICGEGGALCINRPEMVDRAEIIRDKGTNRKQFFRGLVDKYTWVAVGSSYVPSEILSAFLYAQLEMLDEIAVRRRAIYQYYLRELAPLEADGLLRLPCIPADCRSNYHMFYVILPGRPQRDDLLTHLRQQDIHAVFHYVPLHNSPMGCSFGHKNANLPVTEDLSGRLLRLPFYYEITEVEQMRVVEQVRSRLQAQALARP